MAKINDGGPAFPSDGAWGNGHPESGMTLRDYFAAKALSQAILYHGGCNPEYDYQHDAAKAAYRIADAMLAERAKASAQ